MHYDCLIIGAGPAGLCAAIRYAQLCKETGKECRVAVLEKGSEVGAHILSGAVFDPRALDQLIPDWRTQGAPIHTPVTGDHFTFLSATRAWPLPLPPILNNTGHFVISLGLLCRWLGQYAEALGVEIYPGFAATEAIIDPNNRVIGIKTGDLGIDRTHQHKSNFQPGMALYAQHILLAEGCRGSLTQQLIQHYQLAQHASPQTYAIGIKELWEISTKHHQPGSVTHTIGFPLDTQTYGGGFLYHWGENQLSVGYVVGLDYRNPYLDPYEIFQCFKQHSSIRPLLATGQCIAYGARALNEGGWQSLPHLTFPGGALLGCAAGFLNVPQIKGSHNAMLSGILAANAIFENDIQSYSTKIHNSWIGKELFLARNIRPAFRAGVWMGLAYAAIDTYVLRGHAPWTFSHRADDTTLQPANTAKPLVYPKHDGVVSFDRLTSLSRANVYHEENQPCHLVLKDPSLAVSVNWSVYAGPETRYCPAGVYEYLDDPTQGKILQINAQNCIHCKTCDIKDPKQNIVWQPPEGGGGPHYSQM